MQVEKEALLYQQDSAPSAEELREDGQSRPKMRLRAAGGLIAIGLLAGGVAASMASHPVPTETDLGSLKSALSLIHI